MQQTLCNNRVFNCSLWSQRVVSDYSLRVAYKEPGNSNRVPHGSWRQHEVGEEEEQDREGTGRRGRGGRRRKSVFPGSLQHWLLTLGTSPLFLAMRDAVARLWSTSAEGEDKGSKNKARRRQQKHRLVHKETKIIPRNSNVRRFLSSPFVNQQNLEPGKRRRVTLLFILAQ